MGKTQSKRSIDITTDPKKVGEGDEVAGKVEKIEDADQKLSDAAAALTLNGEAATAQEKSSSSGEAAGEKKDTEDSSENDKDLTTEKSAAEAKNDGAASDGATAETPKDESGSPKESGAEEISPLADDSIKSKSKKDKVKKKWSFRNISFGKKDKQKPAKTEEPAVAPTTTEATPAANGEADKPTDAVEPTGEAAATVETSSETKPTENGATSEQEKHLNGDDKTPPTPTTEEVSKTCAAAETTTTETTNETKTNAGPAEAAPKETVVEPPVAVAAAVVTNGNGATDVVVANGGGDKNGLAESPVAVEPETAVNIPSNNDKAADDEQPHQNGTNGVGDCTTPPPTPVAVESSSEAEQLKNKSQIEDIAKDLKEKNAAAEVTTQELPVTCE